MSGKYAGGPVAVSDALSRGHYRGGIRRATRGLRGAAVVLAST